MCQRLVCQKREFTEDHLPVKFNDPKFKNEIFLRIDMKHSYFSNFCLQSIFLLLKQLLFAKINSCLCICSCCIK